MANTIPISAIVQVNPGVLAPAGSAIDLNGLILTQTSTIPIGAVQNFASAAAVGAFFGLTSTEYAMAQVYFAGIQNGTKAPGLLYFAQYPENAVAAYLRGGTLGTMALTALQALSGTIALTVNGTLYTSSAISLSGATSFSNAATIIQAGFTTPPFTVSWNATLAAFVITSSTTGTASTITVATGTLATSLNLTTGAILSQGAAAATPAAFMSALVLVNQNWGLFTTAWESILTEKQAFGGWVSTVAPRFGYVCRDSDPNYVNNPSLTFGTYVQANTLAGICLSYGDHTHASFVLGYAASLDFSRTNGRATLAFKTQAGLIPSVTNQTLAQTLQGLGVNFFGAYATAAANFNFMYPGAISGQYLWLDSYLDQIWLTANLQLAMVNLLINVGSIPYNSQGYALINAACQDPIAAAVNYGAIRPGTTLSASQIAQAAFAIGADISGPLTSKGWYLQIQPATAAIRVARTSPSMTLYYADGQSVQALTLASIEVA
ncbi:MAG: DUF3383 domain-containing protein [Rhodospirillales bacterium]|nr:DUF3383 domain-containing protein [Rhodospirillales bacterium]